MLEKDEQKETMELLEKKKSGIETKIERNETQNRKETRKIATKRKKESWKPKLPSELLVFCVCVVCFAAWAWPWSLGGWAWPVEEKK